MKVIFLDFDGVLTRTDEPRSHHYLSNTCIENLNLIIDKIKNVKIVLSTDWRKYYSLNELRKILVRAGLKYPSNVVDVTPLIEYQIRGNEIEQWLSKNNKVDSFVILDDHDDMGKYINRLILTDPNYGLTQKDALNALSILHDKI